MQPCDLCGKKDVDWVYVDIRRVMSPSSANALGGKPERRDHTYAARLCGRCLAPIAEYLKYSRQELADFFGDQTYLSLEPLPGTPWRNLHIVRPPTDET